MKTSDIMHELYNIRSLLIAIDMATTLKDESAVNSYQDRRWCSADNSNVTDIVTQRLEKLIDTIDMDSMKTTQQEKV